MEARTTILIAAGLALGLTGDAAQGAPGEQTVEPVILGKPAGTPGNGNGNGNGNGGKPDHPGNRGRGHGGDRGQGGPPPGFVPPDPGGDDAEEADTGGHPGRGLALGHRGGAPGQCSLDDLSGPLGRAGRSHTAHVSFAALDEAGEFLDGADVPWGRMTYFWVAPTFDFVFNGHNLSVETLDEAGEPINIEYTLAAELQGDEGLSMLCLGSGTVNDGGNVHILASVELDSHLPADLEPFADDASDGGEGDAEAEEGVGLVLLPSSAVDCESGALIEGDGEGDGETLFSTELILYVDSDLEDSEDDAEDGGEDD